MSIPRDRHGDYEPKLIKKYQNTVTQDMEEKILSMYVKGMTTGDIETHMRELYDIDISDSAVSRIMDKIMPVVREWQERPLAVYPQTEIQQCIIHQIRNTTRFVSYKDIKKLMKYPEAVRRLSYTTNAIEGFNRQLRKVAKSKTIFPSDDSLLKMLYLATMDITKKWTGHRQDWSQIHSQLELYFEERLENRMF